MTLDLKSHWKRLGKLERSFISLAAVYFLLLLFAPNSGFTQFLQFVVIVLGIWELMRLSRIGLRKAIWRLRNRLIVAYVLIAVVPLLLIITLVGLGGYIAAGQIEIYLVRSELDRRVSSLQSVLEGLTQVKPGGRQELMRQTGEIYARRYPGVEFLIENGGSALRWPENAAIDAPSKLPAGSGGIALLRARYYAWSSAVQGGVRFVAVMPLTRRYLSEMIPGLGDVYFLQPSTPRVPGAPKNERRFTSKVLRDEWYEVTPAGGDAAGTPIPPPVNRFDLDVPGFSLIRVIDWTHPERNRSAFLLVQTRLSALVQILELFPKVRCLLDEVEAEVLKCFLTAQEVEKKYREDLEAKAKAKGFPSTAAMSEHEFVEDGKVVS